MIRICPGYEREDGMKVHEEPNTMNPNQRAVHDAMMQLRMTQERTKALSQYFDNTSKRIKLRERVRELLRYARDAASVGRIDEAERYLKIAQEEVA